MLENDDIFGHKDKTKNGRRSSGEKKKLVLNVWLTKYICDILLKEVAIAQLVNSQYYYYNIFKEYLIKWGQPC